MKKATGKAERSEWRIRSGMYLQVGEKAPEPFDWLHKVAEVITSLMPAVWPLTIVILAFVYREAVSDYIRRMKQFKGAGIEASTEDKLEVVEEKTVSAAADSVFLPSDKQSVQNSEAVPVVSDSNPFETVLKSWVQVEEELRCLAEAANLEAPSNRAAFFLATLLARRGFIGKATLEAIDELRRFRNTVVHQPSDVSLSAEQSVRYAQSASIIATQIKDMRSSLSKEQGSKAV